MPLTGLIYMVFEVGLRYAWDRLERFLIKDNSGWSDELIQKAIFKYASDHLPIVLSLDAVASGLRPFSVFQYMV